MGYSATSRPRLENPPPWDRGGQNYFRSPNSAELADHITQAIKWAVANSESAPANTILVYAWNEHDEGGWLCPTLKADGSIDTSRIDALGKAITQAAHSTPLTSGPSHSTPR